MKSHDIFNAINEIDDDLILDAENIPAITGMKYSRIFAAVAMLILAAGSCLLIHNSKAKETLIISQNNDVIISGETESSYFWTTTAIYSTTKQNTTLNNTENINVSSEPVISEPTIPHMTTEISSDAEIQTDVYDLPQSSNISPDNPDYDSTDGIGCDTDKENFSPIPIEQWLENTNVIWGKSDMKGTETPVEIPPETAEISTALQKIIEENPDPQTIFAVTVDFSASINENEMNHWEYNGNTLSEIMAEISTLTEITDTDDTKEKMKQLKTELNELKSAYYSEKIESLRSTFEQNGLGIYPSRSVGAHFCTFGTAAHFFEFICSDNEAFIFYPAGYFK